MGRSLLNPTVQLGPTRNVFRIAAFLQPAPFAGRARLPCRRTKPLVSGAAVGRFAFGRTSRSGRPDDVGAALLVWLAGRSALARGSMCDEVGQPRAGLSVRKQLRAHLSQDVRCQTTPSWQGRRFALPLHPSGEHNSLKTPSSSIRLPSKVIDRGTAKVAGHP